MTGSDSAEQTFPDVAGIDSAEPKAPNGHHPRGCRLQPLGGGGPDSRRMGGQRPDVQAGDMTHHVRDKEPGTAPEASADIDVPDRDVPPRKGEVREFLGLALAAGAGALFVVRPEFYAAGVHILATQAAALVH
ncbi:hypothetical protein [Streptomyces sp. B1-3]